MEPEFSNASIMNAMEKFVSAVQEMDETILVPCRLMDLKVGDSADKEDGKTMVHQLMNHADLYSLYTMVNAVKNELLWGQNLQPSEDTTMFNPGVVHGESPLLLLRWTCVSALVSTDDLCVCSRYKLHSIRSQFTAAVTVDTQLCLLQQSADTISNSNQQQQQPQDSQSQQLSQPDTESAASTVDRLAGLHSLPGQHVSV